MKTYPPLLQEVLDETAAERKFITNHFKAVRENLELKELLQQTIYDYRDMLSYIRNPHLHEEFKQIITRTQSQLNNITNNS
jgi:hypothetical protein